MALEYRDVVFMDMDDPNFGIADILNPENVVLKVRVEDTLDEWNHYDIGSLAYSVVGSRVARYKLSKKVDKKSFVESRRDLIKKFILFIAERRKISLDSAASIIGSLRIAAVYISYIYDNHKNVDPLDEDGLKLYTKYLLDRIRLNEIVTTTAAESQNIAVAFYAHSKKVNQQSLYSHEMPFINITAHTANSTESVDDDIFDDYLGLISSLFDACYDIVINKKDLPYSFYINDTKLTFFAGRQRILSPQGIINMSHVKTVKYARDYENGRSRTRAEFNELIKLRTKGITSFNTLYNDISYQKKANEDECSLDRMKIAGLGGFCFFTLFLVSTGANPSPCFKLTFSEGKKAKSIQQGKRFISVKRRAGNKEVWIGFEAPFLPVFKKYLILREYLDCHQTCPSLFVFVRDDGTVDALSTRGVANYRGYIKKYLPEYSMPTHQGLRKTKTEAMVKEYGIETAASLAGHKVETLEKNYMMGSLRTAAGTLTDFYARMRNTAYEKVKTKNKVDVTLSEKNNEKSIKIGHCNDYGNPKLKEGFNQNAPQPNCKKKTDGCLFCEYYTAHAKGDDTRKLFSFLFIILAIKERAVDMMHFEEVWGAVVSRIEEIIETIKKNYPEQIDAIDKDYEMVFEDGELTDYWSSHYNMLNEIGMVE